MDFLIVVKSALIQIVSSAIRTVLVSGLSWLVARNFLDASTSSQLEALVPIAIGAIAWSFIEKYAVAKLHLDRVLTALQLPQSATIEDLKAVEKEQKRLGKVSRKWKAPKRSLDSEEL